MLFSSIVSDVPSSSRSKGSWRKASRLSFRRAKRVFSISESKGIKVGLVAPDLYQKVTIKNTQIEQEKFPGNGAKFDEAFYRSFILVKESQSQQLSKVARTGSNHKELSSIQVFQIVTSNKAMEFDDKLSKQAI